ncbi:hypothetical protein [Micromonospora rubida]|uniref:hypothetical protein n=1 Tax=Micromonospora rubida TaxID=2697657 RepID=UPI0013778904|nr:hypothetical protein [Micromonospora rubida]NBE82010.1 hypothetical protein [Micromonospora rubida]
MEEPMDHLVWVDSEPGPRRMVYFNELWPRIGIRPDDVYRTWGAGFGARLTTAQLDALRAETLVRKIEADTPTRPAPYRRSTSADRVPGSYIVQMRPGGADPEAAARQVGVAPTGLFRTAYFGFAANMTDAQLDVVRQNPDVIWVMDDILVGP